MTTYRTTAVDGLEIRRREDRPAGRADDRPAPRLPAVVASVPPRVPAGGGLMAIPDLSTLASSGVADTLRTGLWLEELWRYPVKSLAGEQLAVAELRADGIVGDRLVQVYDARTRRIITSRTRPKLLGLRGTTGPDGCPLVDGQPWDSSEAAAAVRAAAGPDARLARYEGPERFDVLPLLVATDGAIAAFDEDHRRLRPNLVIGGVEGLAERTWPGRLLRIGQVVIGVDSLRQRCIMTTFHPDTLEQDVEVLRRIRREFGGELALNCRVVAPGTVGVGDPVELI